MDGEDSGRMIYLVILLAAVAGTYMIEHQRNLGRVAKQAAIWVLIFLGVIAVVGLWDDIRRNVVPRQATLADGRIEVPVAPDGHYYLTLELNGTDVRFAVDTGASEIVLTMADAARIGIDTAGLAFLGQARTANGIVRTAPVRLDLVRLGTIEDRRLRASVNEGELDTSLLGMSYLSLFERVEIARDRLILTR